MKSSARQAARKWSSGLNTCGQRPMAVFAMAMLVTMLSPADARPRAERADDVAASQAGGRSLAAVPLPRPRPADAPFTSDLAAGIRDVQLAEACYRSAAERKWVALDDIAG